MNKLIKRLISLQQHIEKICNARDAAHLQQDYDEHIADLTACQDNIIDQLHKDYHKSDEDIKYLLGKYGK